MCILKSKPYQGVRTRTNPFGLVREVKKGNIFAPFWAFKPVPVIPKRRTRSKPVQKPFKRRSFAVHQAFGKATFCCLLGFENDTPKGKFWRVSQTTGLEFRPGWWTDAWDFRSCNSICSALWKFKRILLQITNSGNHKSKITCWTLRLCSSKVSNISSGMRLNTVFYGWQPWSCCLTAMETTD